AGLSSAARGRAPGTPLFPYTTRFRSSESTTAGPCAGSYVLHRTWTATDNCGNATTSATQDITVSDTTGPVLAGVPANTSADCASVPAAAQLGAAHDCSGVKETWRMPRAGR